MPSTLPPLILLPGTLCDERVFAPMLRTLHEQFRALPAHVIITAQYHSIRSAAEHVLATAPRRFALLGFSLGAILALEIALLAPHRVMGLALLNVNAAPAPAHTHAARRAAVLQADIIGHAEYVRQHLWHNYVAPSAQQNTGLLELIASMAQDLGHTAFLNQTEAALTRRDYRPLLANLTMPTLVQAGEHDAVCTAAVQQRLALAFPQAVFTVIADAGHFTLLEQQEAVAASVAGWFHTISEQNNPMQENQ